jgi:hypothetical protein
MGATGPAVGSLMLEAAQVEVVPSRMEVALVAWLSIPYWSKSTILAVAWPCLPSFRKSSHAGVPKTLGVEAVAAERWASDLAM